METVKSIVLEDADTGTRALIFEQSNQVRLLVDVFECKPNDEDHLWAHIYALHPDLNAVLIDGEPELPDCLTIREAAEAAFNR